MALSAPSISVPVSSFETDVISIMVSIVVLATIAAVLSKKSSTASVIKAFTGFYAAVLSKVTSPISGS